MKLRILGNSIRMRISQTELKTLHDAGKVEMKTDFGQGQIFTYSIHLKPEKNEAHVVLQDREISVFLGRNQVEELVNTDLVGIYSSAENITKIAVEKDFKCLTERDENESDLFPNPNEKC